MWDWFLIDLQIRKACPYRQAYGLHDRFAMGWASRSSWNLFCCHTTSCRVNLQVWQHQSPLPLSCRDLSSFLVSRGSSCTCQSAVDLCSDLVGKPPYRHFVARSLKPESKTTRWVACWPCLTSSLLWTCLRLSFRTWSSFTTLYLWSLKKLDGRWSQPQLWPYS